MGLLCLLRHSLSHAVIPLTRLFGAATAFQTGLVVGGASWSSAPTVAVRPRSPRWYRSCTDCPPSHPLHSEECVGTERLRNGILSAQNPSKRSRPLDRQ